MKCKFCGEELGEEAKFCVKCGKNLLVEEEENTDNKICPKCKEVRNKESRFCSKCGYDYQKVKKNKNSLIIISAIVAIVLVLGGGTGYILYQKSVEKALYEKQLAEQLAEEAARQEVILTYQEKAKEIYITIKNSQSNFEGIGLMYDACSDIDVGILGPSFFISYVRDLCKKEITEEENRKEEIELLYSELESIGCEEEEILDLEKALDDYYLAYSEWYNLLIEGEFEPSEFASKNTESKNDFESKYLTIQTMIDGLNL